MNGLGLSRCLLVAFSCLLCLPVSGDDSKDALKGVLKALRSGDAKTLEASLEEIIKVGGEKSISGLLKYATTVPASSQTVYWSLLEGISSFVDKPALEELGEYIFKNKSKAIARDLLHALQTSRSRNVVYALTPIIRKGPDSLRLKAIKKLARVRNPEAVDVLVEVVKGEEKKSREEASEVMIAAVEGLTMITNQQFGTSAVNWEGWWNQNKNKPLRINSAANEDSNTGTVVDHLSGLRKKGFVGLEKAPKKGIVVVSAVFEKAFGKKTKRDLNNDHMEEVLRRMGIPHTVVHREDFDKFDLRETGAILVNCAQMNKFCICPTCKPGGNKNNRLYRCTGCDKHTIFNPALSAASVEKLKKFVLAGGYLFSEDWIVKEFVEKAFPKFVEAGYKLPDHNVTIAPVRGMATHPYLEGIYVAREEDEDDSFDFGLGDLDGEDDDAEEEDPSSRGKTVVVKRGEDHKIAPELRKIRHNWQIDDESFELTIKNRARVIPLLGSSDVKPRSPDDKKKPVSVVALAFRPGTGKTAPIGLGKRKAPPGTPGVVVQVLSHFGKQHSDEDEFSLQNLLLNFLIDSNTARLQRGGKKRKR